MRMNLAAALMAVFAASASAADSTTSGLTIQRQGGQVRVTVRNVTHILTGEIVSPRAQREQLLLRFEATTTEVLDEKGIVGKVLATALPLDTSPAAQPLFRIDERGRDVVLDEQGLIAIDLDECCNFERAYYSVWTGEPLFEASAPPAWVQIGSEFRTARVAAFRAATDDLVTNGSLPARAVGLITYAAADRVIRKILIEAPDAARARELRSIWDEQFALAWIDAITGLPLPPDIATPPGTSRTLRLLFAQAGIDLRIPLVDDDLRADNVAGGDGLAFTPLPQMPLAGTWRVADAASAPWASGTMPTPLKGRQVVFGLASVRSGTVLDCAQARYETRGMAPAGLFQGAFAPERAAEQAAARGMSGPEIISTLLTCDAGVFDFHMAAGGKALFALDGVIYTLERALP